MVRLSTRHLLSQPAYNGLMYGSNRPGWTAAALLFCSGVLQADESLLINFDDDTASLLGHSRQVAGVLGKALALDGYTTAAVVSADKVPVLRDGFTVAGWFAVAAYPWGDVALIDQADDVNGGFSLAMTARGALSLTATVDQRSWVAISDDYVMPHRQWVHVSGRYNPDTGLSVFLDGEIVATTAPPAIGGESGRNPGGRLAQATALDLYIGGNRNHARPEGYHRFRGTRPGYLSFDGFIDEVAVQGNAASDAHIQRAARQTASAPVMAARMLPSGPQGSGTFGAYYTTLSYHPEWDALQRVGPHADVIVRFDNSPARVVFWRGTQYSPAWVTGNGLWMADQSVEGYDDDYTWEHMNDKHNRYSHVRVVEQTDARVVVHWRYAPVNVNNELMHVDDRDEIGAWVDEYYTFYPDVSGVRSVTWQSGTLGEPIQFQESIPLAHPGQVQGDIIEKTYATVGNLDGDRATLHYGPVFGETDREFPDDLVIQLHHFRSKQKPFIVFEPGNNMGYLWDMDERSLERPGSSSHWPVGRIWSDGRTAQAPDRTTSFLGFPISEPVIHEQDDGRSRINSLYGMSDKDFDAVLALARSWSQPPRLTVDESAFENLGFNRSERAWILRRVGDASAVTLTLDATDESPLNNIPIVIRDWGDTNVSAEIDGQRLPRGSEFRFGHAKKMSGTDLVLFFERESSESTTIRLVSE